MCSWEEYLSHRATEGVRWDSTCKACRTVPDHNEPLAHSGDGCCCQGHCSYCAINDRKAFLKAVSTYYVSASTWSTRNTVVLLVLWHLYETWTSQKSKQKVLWPWGSLVPSTRVFRKWWWSIHPLMKVLRISCKHKHVYLRAQGGRKAKRRAIRTPQIGEWIKNMWYDLTTGHIPWKLKVQVTHSCPTLCDPMDCSTPRSSVHGTLQVRTLEWVAISFSRVSSTPRDWTWVSCIAGIFFAIWATREAYIYPEEIIIEKDTFTSTFIAALFTLY